MTSVLFRVFLMMAFFAVSSLAAEMAYPTSRTVSNSGKTITTSYSYGSYPGQGSTNRGKAYRQGTKIVYDQTKSLNAKDRPYREGGKIIYR